MPAPVHRLDKDTSGLLVAGKTYAAVRLLTDALAGRGEERAAQGYLAWGGRRWEKRGPEELRDFLTRDRREQRVKASAHAESDEAREARCVVTPLEERTIRGPRAQRFCSSVSSPAARIRYACSLPSRGHPIVGDPWYGNAESAPREGLETARLPSFAAASRRRDEAFRARAPVEGAVALPPGREKGLGAAKARPACSGIRRPARAERLFA